MNNSLIPMKNFSIFERIKNFFKVKIFKQFKEESQIDEVHTTMYKGNKLDFGNTLKVNISKTINTSFKLEQFIEEIESNPDIINNLSNDRLDRLIKYYEELTREKQQKIEKLKQSLN